MGKILRLAAPVLIVGALLVANLLPLNGTEKAPRIEEKSPPPQESVPTPVEPPGERLRALERLPDLYSDLPGRLFFLAENVVAVMADGRVTQTLLPDGYMIPAPIGKAVSPDGHRMAVFSTVEGVLVLQVSELESGRQPAQWFPVRELGQILWSPDGKEPLVWSMNRVTLRLANGSPKEIAVSQGVTDVVWSPDGGRVAIETPVGSILLFDRQTAEQITLEGVDPAWGSRGLLYLRRAAPSQVILRTPAGEEVVTDLRQSQAWAEAKVVDLSYRGDTPFLNTRPGAPPAQIELRMLKQGAQPDSLLFTFQEGNPATRYGVGKVINGKVQLWFYPVSGNRQCQPVNLRDYPGGLMVSGEGEICRGMLTRLRYGEDEIQAIDPDTHLFDVTGSWSLQFEDGRVTVTDLDHLRSQSFAAVLGPFHWDGRR